MNDDWIGIDIGGANLKLAGNRSCISESFALWQQPDKLASEIQKHVDRLGPFGRLAVTMTGELADCYQDKLHGVCEIVDAVQENFSDRKPLYYQTSGQFVEADRAKSDHLLTAASNWHAMATVVGQWCSNGMLIDIGSTTTDIIPILNNVPVASGQTDLTRMVNCELLYTGASRTNTATVVNEVVLNNKRISIASELFATVKDVYIALGELPEAPSDFDNADGRASTKPLSMHRLARTLCSDIEEMGEAAIIELAQQIASEHQARIGKAITTVLNTHSTDTAIVVGSGAWLAKKVLKQIQQIQNVIGFEELIAGIPFAHQLSSVGPAWAIKCLAEIQQQREISGLSN